LLYSIVDFALFAWPEIANWRNEMDLFETRYSRGAELIADTWLQLLKHTKKELGEHHVLTKDIEWRLRRSRHQHRRLVRNHRARMFWESWVPAGIATATMLLRNCSLVLLCHKL
jgi:hypothetical protein